MSRDWYVGQPDFKVEFEAPCGGSCGLGVVAIQDDAGFTVFLEQFDKTVLRGQSSCTIQIADVDTLFQRLNGSVKVVAEPGQQFWGYGAVVADPDGHLLHVYDATSMNEKRRVGRRAGLCPCPRLCKTQKSEGGRVAAWSMVRAGRGGS